MKEKTRTVARMGMLLTLAVVLNLAEGMLPALPMLPPGVRLGLSNLVILYAVSYLGGRQALLLAVLKSGFVLLTRGPAAGFISLCGGLLSVLVMVLVSRTGLSILTRSMAGALAHNLGQLLAAALLLGSWSVFYYSPVLALSGIVMGSVTAVLTRATLPALRRIRPPRR